MMILFRCNLCGNEIKKLFKKDQPIPPYLTCECGGALEKQLPEFSTSSLEIVDTGVMARKVELRKDAVQRFKEKGDIYIDKMKKRDRVKNED